MIVLISFTELETFLFDKAATEVGVAQHVRYINDASPDDVSVFHAQLQHARKAYPKVLILNLDNAENDWRPILTTLKENEHWKKIPVLGFSFSDSADIVEEFYAMRGASLIRKPNSYEQLVNITKTAMQYWMTVTTLPNEYLTQY